MLTKRTLILLFSGLFALALASSAQGVSHFLNLADCDAFGCEGSTLYLQVDDLGDGSYDVLLRINTDGYTGDRLGFNQVGFLAIKDWTSVSLVSAPEAGWADPVAGVTSSNNLCAVGGPSDKVCTYGFVDITGGGDHEWKFNVVGGTIKTDEWHIGAQYANAAGTARGKIISAEGTSASGTPVIPEPSAALVFGIGALILGASARRARRRA